MSNIDKKWLQQTIAEMEEHRDLFPGDLDDNHENVLSALRIALASIEAEAVGFIARHKETGKFGSYLHPKADWFKNDEYEVLNAYTAPPAPVSVPDEATPENIEILASTFAPRGVTYQWDRDECNAAADSWNACRAARLQGDDGNSPVNQDGLVACSERMPEVGVKVLCFPVNDEPIHATYNGQVWLQDISWSTSDEPIDNVISCNVFHWMPLPAAPQQEVK